MNTTAANRRSAAAVEAATNGAGMPVILYLRKSNLTAGKGREETVSIQQQRHDLREMCERRGWIILREYVDDGRSASKNDQKRVEFARLLSEAESRADFRAVVVWDLSRLTRKDSVDAAVAAGVFKSQSILVESLRDGEIDLNTSMGRTVWAIHTEANSEFAKKVSGGTIRGRDDSLKRGNWPHGRVPYGYLRQYWDGATLVKEMHRSEKAGKARHWATKIVPHPQEAPFAKRIISDFANRDISIRGLAAEMTKLGAPTMNGKPWTPGHVKDVIRCPAYMGSIGIGYSDGWNRENYEYHGRSEKQTKEDACPAIIDRETWQRANDRLREQAENGTRVHSGKSSSLSGVIYCGHCGRRMVVQRRRGVTYFTCSLAAKNPENPTCAQWTVQEADLLPILTTRLVETLDGAILSELQAKPPEGQAATIAVLRTQADELEAKVKTAARNLALCKPENYEAVESALSELRRELDEKLNTIRAIETAADKTELQRVAQWWREHRPTLVEVRAPEEVRTTSRVNSEGRTVQTLPADFLDRVTGIKTEPDVFRGLLKRLGAKLTLHFTPKAQGPNAKKRFYAVEWGRLEAEIDGHSFDVGRSTDVQRVTVVRLDVRIEFPRVSHRPRLDPAILKDRKAARTRQWAQANRPRLADLARKYRANKAAAKTT